MSETRIPSPTEIEARRTPPAAGPKSNWPNGACRGLRRKAGGKSSSANGKNSRHTLRNLRNSVSRCLCQMELSKETCSDLPIVSCAQGAAHWWRICGVIPRFVLIRAASEKTSIVVFRQATMGTI